jgi:sugar lactone lactonase YvrE
MKQGRILFAFMFLLTVTSLSVFAQVPLADNMPASGVLGTTDFITNTNYASPSTTTLSEPAGVAVDPTTGKLFVADRDNRRVLRWSSADKMVNGSAAEAVLGQPDFVTRTRNTGGLSAATTNDPVGVFVDANGRLWVADMTNNRVLRFDNASTIASASPANGVLGQPDFVTNTAGVTANKMTTPTGVFVDGNGTLWVADRANNRVLRFANAATIANGTAADGVLGQADFVSATTGLTASTMNAPWGVNVDVAGRLWVADRVNNRVLRFDNAASKANGAAADGVIGEPDFTTSVFNKTRGGLGEPRGVATDAAGRLYVVDEGNTRVMVYNNAAGLANGPNANNVLGQTDFNSDLSSPISASSLNYPLSIFIDNANNDIWLPDIYNHRVLRYSVSNLPVELVSFTATVISGKVELSWSTATEKNNAGFAIEKNVNNVWNQIGYVKGQGTSTERKNYSFTENATTGKYQYRLKQIDYDGKFEYSNVVEATVGLTVDDYKLGQNYPNPFNPNTTITFALKNTEHATVTVHNMLGQTVETLFNGIATGNEVYSLTFDAKNLSSGIYFYTLRSVSMNEVRKMSLMK